MIQPEARRWSWPGGAALFAILLALSTPRPAAAQDRFVLPPIPIDTFTLANGLRVIVSQDHSAPLVAVSMVYGVGSAHEAPGRTGFAYLLEHMLFEPTANLTDGEYDRLISRAGGLTGGATDYDRTEFGELLPANQLDLSLWMHAERMARVEISDEAFRAVLGMVLDERLQRVDGQPYAAAQIAVDTLATDYAPYRHPPLGSTADLVAATTEDVRGFYRKYYVPNNAVLTVVGAVTTADVRRAAEEYLGPIPRGAPLPDLPPFPPTPRTTGERRLAVVDPLAQLPLVWITYNAPSDPADAYALSALATILGAGESSRLKERLVHREEAARDVASALRTRRGPGTLLLGAMANEGVDIGRVEEMVSEEVARLQSEDVTERELAKAKNHLRVSLVTGRMKAQTRAQQLQSAVLHHGDPFWVNGEMARYEEVTLEDVRRVARTYLTPANRAVVIARPARGGD